MPKLVRRIAWALVCTACGVSPSRAPLGGSYATPEAPSLKDHKANVSLPQAASTAPPATSSEAKLAAAAVVPAADSSAPAAPVAPSADTLRYDPLKTGDRVNVELTVGVHAQLSGMPPGILPSNDVSFDIAQHVEIKIVKASPQGLDELQLSLALVSMHGKLVGNDLDHGAEPAELFDISFSGSNRKAKISAHDGKPLNPADRAVLCALIVPLSEFHTHWSRAPSLELKAGWSAQTPLSAGSVCEEGGGHAQIGPFLARFAGRDPASDRVPFQVSLPMKYSSDSGQLELTLAGSTEVGTAKGRPSSIALAGPLTAQGGPGGHVGVTGNAKVDATFSYP